ncbi:MAG: formate dehydrogenase accessory sulfurtransferase FdhD [bacterium]
MIQPSRESATVRIRRVRGDGLRELRDRVAVEEPMEIRLEVPPPHEVAGTHQVAVTMRTPGHDFELAAGFLFCEGLLEGKEDLRILTYCTEPKAQEYNVVSARLAPGVAFDPGLLDRNFYTTSSCGVCGKASLEAVEVRGCPVFPEGSGPSWQPDRLRALPAALRHRQGTFRRTGGLHGAALARSDGTLAVVREDGGRHNAVDKVVGHLLLGDALPAEEGLLVVSGRASFEILQKALAAGIPGVAAVGAPSSLAVDLARRFNMTLVGFLDAEGFNVYAGGERVVEDAPDGSGPSGPPDPGDERS